MIAMTTWQLLIWTYRDQQAHAIRNMGWLAWVLGEMGSLDGRYPRIEHDAAMVHACVASLDPDVMQGLIWQAVMGDRPEPCLDQPVPGPVLADRLSRARLNDEQWGWFIRDGRRVYYSILIAERTAVETPVYQRQPSRKGRGKLIQVGSEVQQIDVLYCPLHWEPDPHWVSIQNAMCDAIDEAIGDVEQMLIDEGLLRDHEIQLDPSRSAPTVPAPQLDRPPSCQSLWVATHCQEKPPGLPRMIWDAGRNDFAPFSVRWTCRLRQPA